MPMEAYKICSGTVRRHWVADSHIWLGLLSLFAGLDVWYILTDVTGLVQSKLFPGPSSIVESLAYLTTHGDLTGGTRYGPNIFGHVLQTLQRILLGYSIAVVFGVSLGLLIALNRTIERITRPYIEILRPIPPIAFIPLTIMLLGFGTTQKVLLVFLGGVWPILFNTINGIRGVPTDLARAGLMLGMSRSELLFKVILPAASPRIFTGARIGIGTAAVTVFGAEFIGASDGVGWLTIMAESLLRISDVIVGMIFLALIGLLLTGCFVVVERRVLHWHFLQRS